MGLDTSEQAERPSIVIVPGSFSPPSFYAAVAENLRRNGYEAIVGALVSASRVPPAPAATMDEDAVYFRGIVSGLADEGKDVVILTHSYGGVVGTEAAQGYAKAV